MASADLTPADIDEIKAFLTRTCDEVGRWLPGDGWRPAWKSEAAAEVANGEQRPDGSPWGDWPVRTAYAASAVSLYAALECVVTLRDAMSASITSYVPGVLARAAMEAGSQAWWLLEPGISARRRVIRSVLVRAKSARELTKAVRKADPEGNVSDYGEDRDTILKYAAELGLFYVCNDDRTECEGEILPRYTNRATQLEAAMKMSAAYRIYSGASHAELYSVMQGWRQTGSGAAPLERRPEREAVWAAVLAISGFVMMPTFRAMMLFGMNARMVELIYSMRNVGNMTRRMDLPRIWTY